jgi:hypothetical protein
MRVLICGGRNFSNRTRVYEALDRVFKVSEANLLGVAGTVIHGGATGADALADDWAIVNWKEILVFKADWKRHGKAAGPLRNQQMIDEGKPELVVAFSGGSGTADMVRRAREAGIPVEVIT